MKACNRGARRQVMARAGVGIACGLMAALPAAAAGGEPAASGSGKPSFVDLSLEDLINAEVTSVARRSQRLSDSAAAIFVITGDDIRRSGVTSIPEALRLAPGIEVARLDANKWAISARGFNARFANKLLVLIDGRSVYSHLFSGVFWDEQDTMLDDVERIEVIRGPGATLWGANAVNGVINIITRKAQDTQGTLVSLAAGNADKTTLAGRHGGTTADGTAWRVFAKGLARDAGVDAAGNRGNDDWHSARVGFRADGKLSATRSFTVQADAFGNVDGERLNAPALLPPFATPIVSDGAARGLSLSGRVNSRLDDGEATLQAHYGRNELAMTLLADVREVWDIEFNRHQRLGSAQTLSWGLGYRVTHDEASGGLTRFLPAARTDRLISGFVQDEIAVGESVSVTVGSKFEHNDYTGWEVQPSLRGLWRVSPRQTWWAAVSKAVRTPSRGESDARVEVAAQPSPFPGIPLLVQAQGNPDLQSERLLAWELGWRFAPARHWAVDIAAFHNDYERLRSSEPGTPQLPTFATPFILVPLPAGNGISGSTRGLEVVVEGRPTDQWRLQGSFSHLRYDLRTEPGSADTTSVALIEGSSPRNQLTLRSEWNIDARSDFDAWIKRVDRLIGLGVPAYTSLNLRYAWRPGPGVEWSLVGQNLLDRRHLESRPDLVSLQGTEVQRAVYARLNLRF